MREETAEARIASSVARLLQTPSRVEWSGPGYVSFDCRGTTAAQDSRTAAMESVAAIANGEL
jgi:hypothetical protein